MNSTELQLSSYSFKSVRTYLLATLFIIGNLLLPQMLHLLPQGGRVWLPIYFFTLVGAYRYGWKVGVLTAVASPVLNSILFGMPASSALPLIIIKSVALAVTAGLVSAHFKRVSLVLILLVIVVYQGIGLIAEWILSGEFSVALTSILTSVPGLLVQLLGGYLVLRRLNP
ncbi:MAG: ECF transporter S component [Muribaculaceae bacterium]|nr:ECF transporter S component [Muribaculaceae bacterium]